MKCSSAWKMYGPKKAQSVSLRKYITIDLQSKWPWMEIVSILFARAELIQRFANKLINRELSCTADEKSVIEMTFSDVHRKRNNFGRMKNRCERQWLSFTDWFSCSENPNNHRLKTIRSAVIYWFYLHTQTPTHTSGTRWTVARANEYGPNHNIGQRTTEYTCGMAWSMAWSMARVFRITTFFYGQLNSVIWM